MGILDWLPGRRKTAERSARRGCAAEEGAIDTAGRVVPPAQELTYYFICSPNRSLIEAYHNILKIRAPVYGGSAVIYLADESGLGARQTDANALAMPFAGQRFLGLTVEAVATVADVFEGLRMASSRGRIFISLVTVGSAGQEWVRLMYLKLLEEAKRQGVAPSCMYATSSKDAGQFLLDSFSLVSGP